MAKEHKVEVQDGTDPTKDEIVARKVERRPYLVVAEGGIFKNKKLWGPGEVVLLDVRTGAAFVEAGDVEEGAEA